MNGLFFGALCVEQGFFASLMVLYNTLGSYGRQTVMMRWELWYQRYRVWGNNYLGAKTWSSVFHFAGQSYTCPVSLLALFST